MVSNPLAQPQHNRGDARRSSPALLTRTSQHKLTAARRAARARRRVRRPTGYFTALLALATVALALVAVVPLYAPAVAATPGYALELDRYPYLTDLVGLSVEINWATDTSGAAGSATFGAVDGSGNCNPTTSVTASRTSITVGTVSEYQWKAVLTLPATGTYCYRVALGTLDLLGSDPSPQFTTQVGAGSAEPFSFAVFGDWGQTDSQGDNPDTANLMSQIASSGVRFAVGTGDNGYPSGNQTNAGDLRQTGANVSAIFGPSFWTVPGRSIPFFPAPGNHGISSGTATRSTDEINFPQDVAVATSGGSYVRETYCCVNGTASASYPSVWYAFDAGNARFYVLEADWGDTNVGTGTVYANDYAAHWASNTPEYQWLQSDLNAHATELKFAFFHYPLYSDQKAQNSDSYLQGTASLEGLLASNGVNLVFNGHAHLYERTLPTGPGTLPTYVTGGGGGTLQPIAEIGCSANDAYGIGWSPTRSVGSSCGAAPVPDAAARVFHFLKVTVDGSTVTVTPTDELGRTFDVVTYDFSSGLPDTQIDTAPPAFTDLGTASLTFHSSTAGATFECKLDAAAFAPCASPQVYDSLADGTHNFQVRAVTAQGPDPSPATTSWTVDRIPPSQPTGLAASSPAPGLISLSWVASSDASGIDHYQILRDGNPIGTASGTSFSDQSVAATTTYSYQVVALDGAGNQSQPSNTTSITTPGQTLPLFSDGFESNSLSAWTAKAGLTVQGSITHLGQFAAQADTTVGNTYAKKTLAGSYLDAYGRIWFNAISADSQVNLLRFRTAADASIGYLFVTPSGLLGLRDDVTATTTNSTTGIAIGSGWHSLELHMIVNGAASTTQVWLDGSLVSDLSSTSANLGTTPVGKFQIGEVQSGRTYNVVFDDTAFDTQRLGPGFITTASNQTTIVPGSASVLEGNSGTTDLELPVTLTNPSTQTVTAQWSTVFVPGLAAAADPATDYTPASGTVTFAPGETSKTVSISVTGDTLVEPDEVIVVAFGYPTNAKIGGFYGLGFASILNDDQTTIVPGSASVLEGNSGTTDLEFPVTLTNPSTQTVTAQWSTVFVPGLAVPRPIPRRTTRRRVARSRSRRVKRRRPCRSV